MLHESFMAEIDKQYKERYLCISKQFDNFFFKLCDMNEDVPASLATKASLGIRHDIAIDSV